MNNIPVWPFTLKQGSDDTISMTWLDDNGVPMDLTGFSMSLTIRGPRVGSQNILTLDSATATGSRIDLGDTNGTIDLVFARADTVGFVPEGLPTPYNLASGNLRFYQLGIYDLKYTDSLGNVGYLLEGDITLDPRITV